MHAQVDSALLLCQTPAPPTLPTTVSCFAEQVLLHSKFSAEVQVRVPSLVCGAVCSAPPEFQVTFQVSEDILSLFVSSLFENSAAPTPQRAIEQVPVQVRVSEDILPQFITSLFEHSCLLVTQESTNQVSADDAVPSSPPKLFPGFSPEGVSVERDEGVGHESVGGYASAFDRYLPTLTSPPRLLLPTSCSRQGVLCEDVVEQRVEGCCGGSLGPTPPHLSPHLSLPPPTHFYMRLY